ncbi:MAG: LamG domain-containing protein [Flavobacterium sp.]
MNKYLTVDQFNGSKFIDFGSGKFGFNYDDSQTQYSSITDGGALDFRHSGDFSVVCWVKTTATNSDPAKIGDKDWNNDAGKGFVFAFLGEKWKLNAGDGSDRIDITGNVINDDEWHLLAATFNRTNGKATIYQDGVALGNVDMSAIGDMNSGLPIHLAEDSTGSYGPFTGKLAKIKIFDYALTAQQMLALFNIK